VFDPPGLSARGAAISILGLRTIPDSKRCTTLSSPPLARPLLRPHPIASIIVLRHDPRRARAVPPKYAGKSRIPWVAKASQHWPAATLRFLKYSPLARHAPNPSAAIAHSANTAIDPPVTPQEPRASAILQHHTTLLQPSPSNPVPMQKCITPTPTREMQIRDSRGGKATASAGQY
jgi:hypothetical protein